MKARLTDRPSTPSIVWRTSLCLVPALAWGSIVFGVSSLAVMGVSVGAALVSELAACMLRGMPGGRFTLHDGTALLTGLLVGSLVPPAVPLFVPAIASAFGILVVKQSFGGLGTNWMNPAAAGVVFVAFSWPDAMAKWAPPLGLAGSRVGYFPASSPLEFLRAAVGQTSQQPAGAFESLARLGYPFSRADGAAIGWINEHLLGPLGLRLPRGVFDLFIGNVPGSIGAVALPLLVLGAVYLLATRIIRWQIPVFHLAVFMLLEWALGGLAGGTGLFRGSPIFHLLAGSLILCAFYVATDPVTSPLATRGLIAYGCGLGVLSFLLRSFGSPVDGIPLAVVLMNCVVPLADALEARRRQKGGRW